MFHLGFAIAQYQGTLETSGTSSRSGQCRMDNGRTPVGEWYDDDDDDDDCLSSLSAVLLSVVMCFPPKFFNFADMNPYY